MDNLARLIIRAKQGDKSAFSEIYNLFYLRLFRYCQFNVGKRETAQDLCQDTFLKAWQHLPSFSTQKGGSFQAFLFKIARNLIIDWSRKKKTVPLGDQEIESEQSMADSLESQETTKKVKSAILKLKEKERQIIILRYFEELTVREVAKIVGLREGALRVRTHRILKKLKEILTEL